jgi:hypothetical protein
MNAITSTTIEPATPGQLKQVTRFGSDAIERAFADAGLGQNKPGAQRVIEVKGSEFSEGMYQAALALLKDLSVTDKYKGEEVPSQYGYLSGYKPKSLTEQCDRLRELIPGLGRANPELLHQIEDGKSLPANAEGWFAIPNWMKHPELFGKTYNEALQMMLDLIEKTRGGKFHNYRKGQLGSDRLRQSALTEKSFGQLIVDQVNPDILIVPGQFGLRHRGRSVRRALEVIGDTPSEFGLGAFAASAMLLSHPERLMNYDDLWIDCAGDEYDDPDSDVRFDRAPFFDFSVGKVEFDAFYVDYAYDYYGSASGFASQM